MEGESFETYFDRLVRINIATLNGYSPGSFVDSESAVRISANENNFGTPKAVIDALSEHIRSGGLNRYPDSDCAELREALSDKYGFPADWFMVGNGLDDIINLFALTFLEPDDEVIVPAMTFGVYSSTALMMNAAVVPIDMKSDYTIDTAAIIEAVTSRTKMIFLCTPNNPTGDSVNSADFDRLLTELDLLPVQPILVVDQAYFDYVCSDDDCADAINYLSDHKYIAVLRTFSKMSALAGLRVGYAIAHPQMLSHIYRVRQPYTVNSLAQAAAIADIRDSSVAEFKERVRKSVCESRMELENFFSENGVAFIPSHANFVFAFFDLRHDRIVALARGLADEGIYVRLLKHDNAPGGIRFSIGTPEENKRLIEVLKGMLPKLNIKTE